MKLICAVPSLSMASVTLCRYYSLSSSSLLMYRLKRYLILLLHGMFISRTSNVKFQFSVFVFKLVFRDGLYYVYQLKSSKAGCKFDFNFPY